MVLAAAVGTSEVARRLTSILTDAPAERPRLVPFTPSSPPRRVVAIDGSNVTLAESGSLLVGAYRAGRVDLAQGRPAPVARAPPEIVLLEALDGTAPLRERLRELGVGDLELPRLPPSAVLEHLRTLRELEVALTSVASLRRGDLLLLDGPLQARATIPLMDRLVLDAKARGVDVVGVCKSTSLTIGPVPALAACRLAARDIAATTWFAEIAAPPAVRGRVLIARLSGAETRPFRFDVAAADDDVARVLAGVAALAGHPAYPGYPSPLAMAHNAALLAEEDRIRLLASVQESVLREGVAEADWDAAFLDYHDILDLGA